MNDGMTKVIGPDGYEYHIPETPVQATNRLLLGVQERLDRIIELLEKQTTTQEMTVSYDGLKP